MLDKNVLILLCTATIPSLQERFWPCGHIFKLLALASNLKLLALKPSSPRKFPVFGSRTALFFDCSKRK